MAIGTSAVWEIRPAAGSDANGGGFDATITGAGTDYSLQNAAQVAVTDAVTNGTTTVTSNTANFTSAMVGNACYMSGAGATTGRYFITGFTNSTTITVDRAPGSGSGNTLNLGGALATLTEAYSTRGGIGQNTFWVKNTGTMSITASLTPPAGISGAPTRTIGYNAARGDLDAASTFASHPTIQMNNVATDIFALANTYNRVRNFVLDGNANATNKATRGINASVADHQVENCKATTFTTAGFSGGGQHGLFRRCLATAGSGTAGFNITGANHDVIDCVATSNSCTGFNLAANGIHCDRCISAGNTGASSNGFTATVQDVFFSHGVAYSNGGDGIHLNIGAGDNTAILNCILEANSGKGINSATTYSEMTEDYNYFYNNAGGAVAGITQGAHDINGSAEVFNNPAAGDFSLNNNNPGGGQCRAGGFPGTYSGISSTGYIDVGAVQHQDPASSTGAVGRGPQIFHGQNIPMY